MSYKFNPFTGTFDEVGSGSSFDNFSYELISATVTIPINQQMIVNQTLTVDGVLIMNGTLVII